MQVSAVPSAAESPALRTLSTGPLMLAAESVAFSLAAFGSVQVLLWALFRFDVIGEAFGPDAVTAGAVKTVVALAVIAAVVLAARHMTRARP